MAYEMVSEAHVLTTSELRVDNKGAVKTSGSGQDETFRRFMRRDDPDIAAAIGNAVKRREETGRPAMDVYWIRGHSDEKMDKSEITVHHERQQRVDKLTKERSEHEAICTLQTPGRLRVLYTEDAKDNNEAKHEITEPLRRHIAKTAQSRRSMNHLTEAEKRHYGPDNAKRGEGFIHCQMCPDQILGNNFQPKMVHHLLRIRTE